MHSLEVIKSMNNNRAKELEDKRISFVNNNFNFIVELLHKKGYAVVKKLPQNEK